MILASVLLFLVCTFAAGFLSGWSFGQRRLADCLIRQRRRFLMAEWRVARKRGDVLTRAQVADCHYTRIDPAANMRERP